LNSLSSFTLFSSLLCICITLIHFDLKIPIMKTTTISYIAGLVLSATAAPVAPVIGSASNGVITVQVSLDMGQKVAAAAAFDANQLFTFTSMQAIHAVPEEVINGTEATGGLAGASGTFNFGINSAMNMICYNITLHNFQGDFSSPATTATHIHEAARGASGPPRISFPNPDPVDAQGVVRNSAGCLKGPFVTGVMVDGKDSGEGFHVSMIEANPTAFMADTHSSLALPGAVRGQLA
jgi:hypothetical protein